MTRCEILPRVYMRGCSHSAFYLLQYRPALATTPPPTLLLLLLLLLLRTSTQHSRQQALLPCHLTKSRCRSFYLFELEQAVEQHRKREIAPQCTNWAER